MLLKKCKYLFQITAILVTMQASSRKTLNDHEKYRKIFKIKQRLL